MNRTPGDFECQVYAVPVAGRTVRLLGPKYPHALNREPEVQRRSEEDGYKPYWAQPWPTAVMLVEQVIGQVEPGTGLVLELGAGLGLAGIVLSLVGHRVVVTDYDEDALEFVRASAKLNAADLADVRRLDWRNPPAEQYGLIVASDVVYARRDHEPLAGLLAKCLAPGGRAFISDLNRRAADEFPEALRRAGFCVDFVRARAKAIPAFDAIDGRVLEGRVFRIAHAPV